MRAVAADSTESGQHGAGGQRRDQVEQELRVPARTVDDHLQVVRQQRRVDGRRLRQHDRGRLGERTDLQPDHAVCARARGSPASVEARRETANSHGRSRRPFREMVQQLRRRLVHVMGILDLDQRVHGEQPLEQRRHDLVQLRAPVRFGERVDLGGAGGISASNGEHDQRQPGQQVGGSLRQLDR